MFIRYGAQHYLKRAYTANLVYRRWLVWCMNIANLPSIDIVEEWESHRQVDIPSLTKIEQHGLIMVKDFFTRFWIKETKPHVFSVWRVSDRLILYTSYVEFVMYANDVLCLERTTARNHCIRGITSGSAPVIHTFFSSGSTSTRFTVTKKTGWSISCGVT